MTKMIKKGRQWFKDRTGDKFGRLTVVSYAGEKKWNCVCECGCTITTHSCNLTSGDTSSCGCLKVEIVSRKNKLNTTHGLSHTREYGTYTSMIDRCTNQRSPNYAEYGAKGIFVCDRWLLSFENFLEDMGCRPGADYSLDRINGNSGYCKENCRWASRVEQSNNRKNNIIVEMDGRKIPLAIACKEIGANRRSVYMKMRRGLSFADAIKSVKYGSYHTS